MNVQSGGGDKTGRSHYHAGVVKVNQRLSGGVSLQGSYTYSKIMTDADSFSGSGRAMDAARPELEWSVGRLDQTHSIKINSVFELPFGEGRRWLTTRDRQSDRRRMARRADSGLQQRVPDRRDHQCAAEYLQRHQPAERHRRGLARADCRR